MDASTGHQGHRSAPLAWRWVASLREYWTLAEASAAAAGAGEAARADAAHELSMAWQDRDAAEILLLGGSPADALRVGLSAAAHLEKALGTLGDRGARLSAMEGQDVDAMKALVVEAGSSPPDLDSRVTPAQCTALAAAIRAGLRLERRIGSRFLDAAGFARLRLSNRARVCVAVGIGVVILAFAAKIAGTTRASASGSLNPIYGPDRAIDGDVNTDWVAGGAAPWIEVRLPHARRLGRITLVDGHVVRDRAAKDVRVDIYAHERVVGSMGGVFAPPGKLPSTISLDPAGVRADRVRVTITSAYGSGAALSEILLD
jgi:hypothetical protein